MTLREQRSRQWWLDRLAKAVDWLSRREGARLPCQEEFDKAASLTPREHMVQWTGHAEITEVTDEDGSMHLVAIVWHGKDKRDISTGKCSCYDDDEICAHLLAVLAAHLPKDAG
jgi:uncharacterized Zn finger protein